METVQINFMQNNESYWQKEKRRDNRLALSALVLMFGAALALRWYSDTHQPPVHPLKVTIIENDIPRVLLHSVNLERQVSGEFRVVDNMKELAGKRPIEGGQTQWELLEIANRSSSKKPWTIRPTPPGAKPLPMPLHESMTLPYSSIHHIANHAGNWRITLRATRRYYDGDTKEEWVGSANYVFTRTFKEDEEAAMRQARGLPMPTATPPPGVHPFNPKKDYVAWIQWSPQSGPWRDVPKKGQKGFPLTIDGEEVTGFRAVKKNPREPWPDWFGTHGEKFTEILYWGGDIAPSTGLSGEEVWIQPAEQNAISVDEKDLKTLSFTCGNTVTCEIRITQDESE